MMRLGARYLALVAFVVLFCGLSAAARATTEYFPARVSPLHEFPADTSATAYASLLDAHSTRSVRARLVASTAARLSAAAVLAVLLATTGPHMAHLYDSSGIATCTGVSCGPISNTFGNELPWFDTVIYLVGLGIMFLVPAIVGVFWGSFTSREPEHNRQDLYELLGWLNEGKLKPLISATYPLEGAAQALQDMMDRIEDETIRYLFFLQMAGPDELGGDGQSRRPILPFPSDEDEEEDTTDFGFHESSIE